MNNNLTIKGTITQMLPIQTGTKKDGGEWSKGVFVIKTDGQYPKDVALETTAEIYGKLSMGQTLTFHINVESREYNGRWYTNVWVWKFE